MCHLFDLENPSAAQPLDDSHANSHLPCYRREGREAENASGISVKAQLGPKERGEEVLGPAAGIVSIFFFPFRATLEHVLSLGRQSIVLVSVCDYQLTATAKSNDVGRSRLLVSSPYRLGIALCPSLVTE